MMASTEKIQTLHPDPNKTGKNIAVAKYALLKATILSILADLEPTHLELMEAIHARIKEELDGNAQWYGETVKLDLEARKVIERTKTKPARYRLVRGEGDR